MTVWSTTEPHATESDDAVLRVLSVVEGTSVDGPGLRTSVYLAGCAHCCPGCHNPQSWPFDAGDPVSVSALAGRLIEAGMPVTLTGGDPLYAPGAVTALCRRLHRAGLRIWIYTGFTYEDIATRPDMQEILTLADVLVDGPFRQELRDLSLLFRGSANQRLIDLRRSRPDCVELWQPEW